ncbi:hypothetical protein AALP_AA5G291500 [Arabis alpina]|uniref:Knottin scorpion toxin-like domain-containing protein n=1 Tax=Arabis alpina TaxID=50452 RepID=A0A087H039_ARAAL|nr:hypothetical protein AALP_AA5G291500 [Arabis alpina]
MAKIINLSAILLLVLLVSTGIVEKGEAQAQGPCEWECKRLPNFKCWMGHVGENLCNDLCKNEGAIRGVCVSNATANSHRCLCRNSGCS